MMSIIIRIIIIIIIIAVKVIMTGTPAGVAEGMKGQPWLMPGDKV